MEEIEIVQVPVKHVDTMQEKLIKTTVGSFAGLVATMIVERFVENMLAKRRDRSFPDQ